jgi:hypothetical protein
MSRYEESDASAGTHGFAWWRRLVRDCEPLAASHEAIVKWPASMVLWLANKPASPDETQQPEG